MLPKASINSGNITLSVLFSAKSRNLVFNRHSSTQSTKSDNLTSEAKNEAKDSLKAGAEEKSKKKKKTQAELDEELRQKLECIAGDGGEAGMELENGQPVSMKRGVKNNMFRYI